jgi:hypothetical protein
MKTCTMKTIQIINSLVIIGLSAVNCYAAQQPDGALIKGSNGGLYVIQDGKRCVIPSPAVLVAKGYDSTKAVQLTDADFKAIPQGVMITMDYKTPKNGDLVRDPNGPLYLIQVGNRCVIFSKAIETLGLQLAKSIVTSHEYLEAIPTGPSVTIPGSQPLFNFGECDPEITHSGNFHCETS